jgi:hypothetical protein
VNCERGLNKGFVNLSNLQDVGEGIRQVMILNEADEYHIPYDKDLSKIDYDDLNAKVSEYSYLLYLAEETGVKWDVSNYNPNSLEN